MVSPPGTLKIEPRAPKVDCSRFRRLVIIYPNLKATHKILLEMSWTQGLNVIFSHIKHWCNLANTATVTKSWYVWDSVHGHHTRISKFESNWSNALGNITDTRQVQTYMQIVTLTENQSIFSDLPPTVVGRHRIKATLSDRPIVFVETLSPHRIIKYI